MADFLGNGWAFPVAVDARGRVALGDERAVRATYVAGEPIHRRASFPADHALWRGGLFPSAASVRKSLERADAVLEPFPPTTREGQLELKLSVAHLQALFPNLSRWDEHAWVADLVASTELVSSHDPERARLLLDRYADSMAAEIQDGGGTLEGRVLVQMGTLGKALGCFGAYIAGSRGLRELLINRCRSFIFTTALPPAVMATAIAALDLVVQLTRENALRAMRALTGLGYRPRGPRASGTVRRTRRPGRLASRQRPHGARHVERPVSGLGGRPVRARAFRIR